MNKTFFIGIPTINRADLLIPSVIKYVEDFPNTQIIILDNGNQDLSQIKCLSNITIIKEPENLGVAGSWNTILNMGYKFFANHGLILNDDIYLGKKEEEVLEWINNEFEEDFAVTHKNWCAFILPINTFFDVGEFDTKFFPAYFEDNDYARRMSLKDKLMLHTAFLNPEIYRNSMTIEKEPELNSRFMANKNLYISKWGGVPGEEIFSNPYNANIGIQKEFKSAFHTMPEGLKYFILEYKSLNLTTFIKKHGNIDLHELSDEQLYEYTKEVVIKALKDLKNSDLIDIIEIK